MFIEKYFWEEGRTSVWLSFGKSADGGGYHALQTAACHQVAHIFAPRCPLLNVCCRQHLIEISPCSCFGFAAFGKLQICCPLRHFALLRLLQITESATCCIHLLHLHLAAKTKLFGKARPSTQAGIVKMENILREWYVRLDLKLCGFFPPTAEKNNRQPNIPSLSLLPSPSFLIVDNHFCRFFAQKISALWHGAPQTFWPAHCKVYTFCISTCQLSKI